MPFTRLKKKRKLWTKYIVNLKKLWGGSPITLTTLSLKNRITFFWNQPQWWDVFFFPGGPWWHTALLDKSCHLQVPGCWAAPARGAAEPPNSVEKSTCHHWAMREQTDSWLLNARHGRRAFLVLLEKFMRKLWIGSVQRSKTLLFSLSKHQSIYWESQRKPSPYPCLLSTLHMNTSMGRAFSSFRVTFP